MSVPAYRRSENKLEVLKKCRELFNIVLGICQANQFINEQNNQFLKQQLMQIVLDMTSEVSIANSITMNCKYKELLLQRLKHQYNARGFMHKLIIMCQAIVSMYVDENLSQFEKLVIKIDEFKPLLYGWINNTRKKLSDNNEEDNTIMQNNTSSLVDKWLNDNNK